jgi:hypothetical protein
VIFGYTVALGLVALITYLFLKKRRAKQLEFIQSYNFHPILGKKIKGKYAHLNEPQIEVVFDCLRDYFTFCNQARRRMVAMPSQVVDIAWHEFILFTKAYELFSKKAMGKFLHHTPTVAMKSTTVADDGIKRAWRLACAKENINPGAPSKLPRLFAIDALLKIEDGFQYSINCKDRSSPYYGDGFCAGHIGCVSGCLGDSGSTDSGGFFDGLSGGSDCAGSSDCGGSSCGGD